MMMTLNFQKLKKILAIKFKFKLKKMSFVNYTVIITTQLWTKQALNFLFFIFFKKGY